MGVGIMWGIGLSLDVENERGEMPESGFKDSVSSFGVANDIDCVADEGLLVFDFSTKGAGFIIGGEWMERLRAWLLRYHRSCGPFASRVGHRIRRL
jgi:hypothetical protein